MKQVEATVAQGFNIKKIDFERNDRNKSSYIWPQTEDRDTCKVKLEIGSVITPIPFATREMETYIQNYLEEKGMFDVVQEFNLSPVSINTLDITRTFLDKVMAVKRHAICGTLISKVRHIYDVTALFERDDVQAFLSDTETLKQLLKCTKQTDSFYLQKRNIPKDYNPISAYSFESWRQNFNVEIRKRYETLHEDLLYTNARQNFDVALRTFERISKIFADIDE